MNNRLAFLCVTPFIYGAAVFFFSPDIRAQVRCPDNRPQKVLFDKVDVKSAKLTAQQTEMLDRITKHPSTVSVVVGRLREHALDEADAPLTVILNHQHAVQWKKYEIKAEDGKKVLEWQDAENPRESALVSFRGKSGTGLIYTGGKVYSVEPLGQGLHAIAQIKQSRFPK